MRARILAGSGPRNARAALRPMLVAQAALTLLLAAFLIVPVGMSMLAGLTRNDFIGLRSGLTLHWVAQVWDMYRDAIGLSLRVALATLAITLLAGVPCAYALARSRARVARLFERMLMLPVAMPGLASALGLLAVYGGLRDFRASSGFIVVGHVVFTLPFMVRSVQAICAGIDLRGLEEGAASLGAGFVQRMRTVVLPNIRPGIVAGALTVVTLLAGVPCGYALARSRARAARLFERMLMLPVAMPGLASALGLLAVYGGLRAFRSSSWFIVVGHVVFTLPFMVRSVQAICAGIDLRGLEEGAASLGAGFTQRMRTVVLPNIRPGIVAGALTVVTLSIGEFNLTWMLATPTTKTLPVGLADAYASLRLEVGSAYTLIFFVLIVPLLVLMQRAAGDGPPRRARP